MTKYPFTPNTRGNFRTSISRCSGKTHSVCSVFFLRGFLFHFIIWRTITTEAIYQCSFWPGLSLFRFEWKICQLFLTGSLQTHISCNVRYKVRPAQVKEFPVSNSSQYNTPRFEKKLNKHNAELQRPIPAQKSRGNSVLGVVFSHTMPKMDFHYSHRFSWEKTH